MGNIVDAVRWIRMNGVTRGDASRELWWYLVPECRVACGALACPFLTPKAAKAGQGEVNQGQSGAGLID